jgi:hypothetical protein
LPAQQAPARVRYFCSDHSAEYFAHIPEREGHFSAFPGIEQFDRAYHESALRSASLA